MKKIFLGLAVLLTMGLIMVGCDLATNGEDGAARFTFNGVTYDKVTSSDAIAYANLTPDALGTIVKRTNSSGMSVPSNAHTFRFAALENVYFFWIGNGQNREFFAVVEDEVWEDYCWIGVTTQQGPFGYLYHILGPEGAPAYNFQKLHNNITQAWLEGAKSHRTCPGLPCKGATPDCIQCDPNNCLDCGDACICDCNCPVLPPPCTDCWGCCAFVIPNSAPGVSANPHGAPFEIRNLPGNPGAVVFILDDKFFDVYCSQIMVRSQGRNLYYDLLKTGAANPLRQTINIPGSVSQTSIRFKQADAE